MKLTNIKELHQELIYSFFLPIHLHRQINLIQNIKRAVPSRINCIYTFINNFVISMGHVGANRKTIIRFTSQVFSSTLQSRSTSGYHVYNLQTHEGMI